MKENLRSAEKASPESLAKVIMASETILRPLGIKRSGVEELEEIHARLPIIQSGYTHLPETPASALMITKPIGEFSRTARWAYAIMYQTIDRADRRRVIILNGENPEAEVKFSTNRPREPLADIDALAIAEDLERVAKANNVA